MKVKNQTHIYKGHVIQHVTTFPKYGSGLNFWGVYKGGEELHKQPIRISKSSPSSEELGLSLSGVLTMVDSWFE